MLGKNEDRCPDAVSAVNYSEHFLWLDVYLCRHLESYALIVFTDQSEVIASRACTGAWKICGSRSVSEDQMRLVGWRTGSGCCKHRSGGRR
jgi:hypothetical protein